MAALRWVACSERNSRVKRKNRKSLREAPPRPQTPCSSSGIISRAAGPGSRVRCGAQILDRHDMSFSTDVQQHGALDAGDIPAWGGVLPAWLTCGARSSADHEQSRRFAPPFSRSERRTYLRRDDEVAFLRLERLRNPVSGRITVTHARGSSFVGGTYFCFMAV